LPTSSRCLLPTHSYPTRHSSDLVEIKQAIEERTIPGPRLFVATRAISSTGGYNLEGYAPELEMPKGAQIVDGPMEARKAAREQLDRKSTRLNSSHEWISYAVF